MRFLTLLSLLLLLLLAACTEPAPAPTATAAPPTIAASATSAPTGTPTPPTPTETPAAAPTAGPTLTPAPVPDGFTPYHAPYWVSFSYPQAWQLVRGGSAGVALASEAMDGSLFVPDEGALLFVGERFYDNPSPLLAMSQEFVPTLDAEREPVIRPLHPFSVNGQEAASLGYRYVDPTSGRQLLATVTFVAGPHERMVSLLAITPLDQEESFAPLIRQVTNSLVVQSPAPAPAIGVAEPPRGMAPYVDAPARVRLQLPTDWTVDTQAVQIRLLPPGEEATARTPENVIVVIPPAQFEGDPGASLTTLLDEAMLAAFRPGVIDAIPVSPVSTAEVDGQEMARALYSGTVNGQPVLGLITVVRAGADVLQAVSLISDAERYEEPFAAIMDTLRIEQPSAARGTGIGDRQRSLLLIPDP